MPVLLAKILGLNERKTVMKTTRKSLYINDFKQLKSTGICSAKATKTLNPLEFLTKNDCHIFFPP